MSTEDIFIEFAKVFTVSAEAYIVFDYIDAFFERKVDRKYFLIGVFTYMIAMLLISNVDIPNASVLYLIMSASLISILAFVMYKGNVRTKIVTIISYFLIYLAGEMIVVFSIKLLIPATVESLQKSEMVNLPFLIYDRVLLFIIFKGVVQMRKSSLNRLMPRDFIAVISVSLISIFVILNLFMQDVASDDVKAITGFLVSLGVFLSNIIIFNLFLRTTKFAKIEREQSLILQNIESSENRYKEVVAIQNQIRGMWHDINNHITCVKGMIETEESAAVKYIDELEKKVGEYASQVTFGNSIIDTILYSKTVKAKESGIDISTTLDMDKNIKISPIDLCTIFSNALDNAIEACEEVAEGKRFIRLRAVQNEGILFIKIINSSLSRKKSGDEFRTTKKDKSRHGIGIKSIQNAIYSYAGSLSTEYKDGVFELSILLNTK